MFSVGPTHTADLGFSLLPFGSLGDLSRVMVCGICRGPKPKDSSAEHIQPKGWRTVNFPWFSILGGPSIPVSLVLFSDVHVNEVHVFPPSVRQVAPLSCLAFFFLKLVQCTFLRSCWFLPRRRMWSCLPNMSSC